MLDTTLYNLGKQKFFECGSLAIQALHQRSQSSSDLVQSEVNQKTHHHHHHVVQGNQDKFSITIMFVYCQYCLTCSIIMHNRKHTGKNTQFCSNITF